MISKRLHRWECAALAALSLVLLSGVWAAGSQSALADKVVRLHVIANSNEAADQALKLRVRDAVLAEAGAALGGVTDRAAAEAVLSAHLPRLAEVGEDAVAEAGYDYPVAVSLTDHWFPTREYPGFSLPAGTYRALRVVIGEGAGENWWCVVFPPLCLGAVTEQADAEEALAALTEEEVALITGAEGYVLRFKLVEWWNSLFGRR